MAGAAVNRPTNPADKTASINQKLQLYGILTAFKHGKAPSNDQIDIALNSFLESKALSKPSQELSADGQQLVKDVRDIVEQAKLIVLTKNQGELIQDFMYQTQRMSGGDAKLPGAPVTKDAATGHGNDALEGLRTLGTLIVTNGQFRKLLKDASILLRDMAGDAAGNAAKRVSPSDDSLAQIDQPADDNVWHDAPKFSKENFKQQMKSTYKKSPSKDDADSAIAVGRDSGVEAGANEFAERAQQNLPEGQTQEAKSKQAQAREKTKNYLSTKMPQERREQTIWRLKKMVVEIQGHSDYQRAINTLLTLAETYGGHARTMSRDTSSSVKHVHEDGALRQAEDDLKLLLERFANATSADNLLDSISNIYKDANKDPELKDWFKEADVYVRKCLQEQGYIMDDIAKQRWNELYDKGQYLFRDKYRTHTDNILDEIQFMGDQFGQDQQNKKFGQSVNKLFKDLGTDESGKTTFKPHLVKDITEVILPAALENIAYVPLPRIEYTDPQLDLVLENLIIESDNLMPNLLQVENHNNFLWGRKGIKNRNRNAFMLHVSGIQMDLRDVAYYVKRKKGFPTIGDSGLADIFLGGSGFSFKMRMSTPDEKDRQNFFKVSDVQVDVKNFNIKLRKSNHKLLFRLARPIIVRAMRPALQMALQKVIKNQFNEYDRLLYQAKLDADKRLAADKNDPEASPNNKYSYWMDAVKQQMAKRKEAAAEKKKQHPPKGQTNITMTHDTLLLPGVKLPGATSTKANEYKQLAMSGNKWESPVFSMGHANKTTSLPRIVKPVRKIAPKHAATRRANKAAATFDRQTTEAGYSSGTGAPTGTGAATTSTGAGTGYTTGTSPATGSAPPMHATAAGGTQQPGEGTNMLNAAGQVIGDKVKGAGVAV